MTGVSEVWGGSYASWDEWGYVPLSPASSSPRMQVQLAPPEPEMEQDYYAWDQEDPPSVLLYIDNSNIFESAKKYSGCKKGYRNGIPDVACRIDIGKMTAKALAGRKLLFGKLYGSEPPALDSVWDAIRKKHVHVETFQRSKWTLKEKETDSSLTADAVEDIIIQQDAAGNNRTLVLFSGDRDLLRVVKKALKFGYRVEIWSFKSSINNTIIQLTRSDPEHLKIFYIDDIFEEITFTKVVWGKKKIPRERSLVTSITLPENCDRKSFLNKFVAKAGDTFKLPMMGKYLNNYQYILLVPCIKEHYTPVPCLGKPKSEQMTTRTYDYYKHVQPFTHMLEEYYATLQLNIKIKTFIEFISARHSPNDNNIISGHRFQLLKLDNDNNEEDSDVEEDIENLSLSDDESEDFDSTEFFDFHHEDLSDDADGEDFIPLIHKEKRVKRQYSDYCVHKFWCSKGFNCSYKHSDKEKEFFKVQSNVKLRHLYKIKPCYHKVCPYLGKTYLCGYAHSMEESRCLCCKQQGNGKHWMDKCPLNKKPT